MSFQTNLAVYSYKSLVSEVISPSFEVLQRLMSLLNTSCDRLNVYIERYYTAEIND